MRRWFVAWLGFCAVVDVKSLKAPTLEDVYHVSGILSLPYAEIEEPFEAWYNLPWNVSRIDYYHGQVVTLQHAFEKPAGISYKISPETTETELNVIKCFQVNGTIDNPVHPQSIFPSLKDFHFLREEDYKGHHCSVWQNFTLEGAKNNTYTIWIANSTDGPIPIYYKMKGFSNVFLGHYDKYELDYQHYDHDVEPSIFKRPEGLPCSGFFASGKHRILNNPMEEFVEPHNADNAHNFFQDFKKKYDRDYENDEKEHEFRKSTFTHNRRYIHSMNRRNLTYKMTINHFTDRTGEEMISIRGRLKVTSPNKGQPFPAESYKSVVLPPSIDWRSYGSAGIREPGVMGAVTPVKDQAVCGSCWSFSSTGVLEGALFLKTGFLVLLSQQMLMDCSWGFGNIACDGGLESQAFEFVLKHGGISTEESYGSYRGQNGFCHYNQSTMTAKMKHYTNVTSGNQDTLKMAIFKNGPVSVGMDATQKSFRFYSNGVYYEPKCRQSVYDLDHAVLAVGYGILDGQSYWLIKNSWSAYWGNNGYVLISMKNNDCGVTLDATYVTLE